MKEKLIRRNLAARADSSYMPNITDLPIEVLQLIFEHLDCLKLTRTKLSNMLRKPRLARIVLRRKSCEYDLILFDAARVCRAWQELAYQVILKDKKELLSEDDIALEKRSGRLWALEMLCKEANDWIVAERSFDADLYSPSGQTAGLRETRWRRF